MVKEGDGGRIGSYVEDKLRTVLEKESHALQNDCSSISCRLVNYKNIGIYIFAYIFV
jgi:hypothetical protein